MKTLCLLALLVFLAACGKEEAHDQDHGSDKTPAMDTEKLADKMPAKTDAESMADKAPETGGAEMRTITLAIEGMS